MVDINRFDNMFLINAPAGSGKTTYIENTIINLLAKYPNRKILSITYTNRAKEELNSRINSKNVIIDIKYFTFCQQEYYDKYLNNPNSTNAKNCFKTTKIKGILWAYKLFYVGCSRAKENLVIVVDENKIASYGKEFIKRMISIGFDVIGGELYGEENRDSYERVY